MSRIEWSEQDLDELATLLAPRLVKASPDALQALANEIRRLGELEKSHWMDSTQAAKYLGISRGALHQHTAARTIPFEQDVAGGKLWFKADELDAWRRGEKGKSARSRSKQSRDNSTQAIASNS